MHKFLQKNSKNVKNFIQPNNFKNFPQSLNSLEKHYFTSTFRKTQGPYNENNLKGYVNYFRKHSHKFATIDPLGIKNKEIGHHFLPEFWGLSEIDQIDHFPLDESSTFTDDITNKLDTIKDLDDFLRKNYLSSVGVEFEHIDDEEEKLWLYENYEKIMNQNPSNIELQNCFKVLYPA